MMKKYLFLLLLLCSPAAHAVNPVWSSGFESGCSPQTTFAEVNTCLNTDSLSASGDPNGKDYNHVTYETAPVCNGTYSMKARVDYSTTTGENLVQATLNQGTYAQFAYGQVWWWSFSVYIPDPYPVDSYQEQIWELHGYPDLNLGETWRNAPVSIRIEPNLAGYVGQSRFVVNMLRDDRTVTPKGGYQVNITQDLGAVTPGWHHFVITSNLTWTSAGTLKVWLDGTVKFDRTSGGVGFNDVHGPWLKFGIYKKVWDLADANCAWCHATDVTYRELYYDDIKVGDATATYADMATTCNAGVSGLQLTHTAPAITQIPNNYPSAVDVDVVSACGASSSLGAVTCSSVNATGLTGGATASCSATAGHVSVTPGGAAQAGAIGAFNVTLTDGTNSDSTCSPTVDMLLASRISFYVKDSLGANIPNSTGWSYCVWDSTGDITDSNLTFCGSVADETTDANGNMVIFDARLPPAQTVVRYYLFNKNAVTSSDGTRAYRWFSGQVKVQ